MFRASESYLWSGSVDRTLRVWEVGTGKCLGVLSGANGGPGHKDAISCLEFVPAAAPSNEAYIASGGGEGDVKLWKTNGEFVHSCSHTSFVTALKTWQDSLGGKHSDFIEWNMWWSNGILCCVVQVFKCC